MEKGQKGISLEEIGPNLKQEEFLKSWRLCWESNGYCWSTSGETPQFKMASNVKSFSVDYFHVILYLIAFTGISRWWNSYLCISLDIPSFKTLKQFGIGFCAWWSQYWNVGMKKFLRMKPKAYLFPETYPQAISVVLCSTALCLITQR